MDVLAKMGTVSAAELAVTLGRPADALYYHLRILQKAGLVEDAGSRLAAGKRQALFRAVGPELRIDYEAGRLQNGWPLCAVVASMLRLGIRDFRQAVRNQDVIVSGGRRELWALRKTGWLTANDLANVNKSVEKLANAVKGPRGPGRLYGITILLTPLNRRRSGNKGRKTPKSQSAK